MSLFFCWIYFISFVTLNSQILLECSDIRIERLWVLIYICGGIFIYNLGIVILHVFYFSFRWGPFVLSLGIVQWNSTRRDHPGNPGEVSGSGPVRYSLVSPNKPRSLPASKISSTYSIRNINLLPLTFRYIH